MALKPVSFFSGALFRRNSCFVYLPPGYDQSEQIYPVVYLLHGMFGSESDWLEKGNAIATIESLVKEGLLRESIVVMPNDGGYGHGTFYMNWYDGSGRFEDYFIYDLIPFIDSRFRTVKSPGGRALCGLSMGGYGAMMLALRNPQLFGAGASLSGALGKLTSMNEQEFTQSDFSRMTGPMHGSYAVQYDLYDLAIRRLNETIHPALYFDCGKEDFLYDGNIEFLKHMTAIGYPVTYKEFSGAHTWEYWTEHLADALQYIEAFFRKALP